MYQNREWDTGVPFTILSTVEEIKSNISSKLEEYKFDFGIEFCHYRTYTDAKGKTVKQNKATWINTDIVYIGEFLD